MPFSNPYTIVPGNQAQQRITGELLNHSAVLTKIEMTIAVIGESARITSPGAGPAAKAGIAALKSLIHHLHQPALLIAINSDFLIGYPANCGDKC